MENLLNIGSFAIITVAFVTYWKIKKEQKSSSTIKRANNIHYKWEKGSHKKAA
jgi:hypothetical protein